MRLWTASALLLSLAVQNQANNILVLNPLSSWSEYRFSKVLADTLAEVGHQVTLVSGFQANKESLVKEIYIGSSTDFGNIFELNMITALDMVDKNQKQICNKMYTDREILDIWKNRNDFDAIIAPSLVNEIISPFVIGYNGAYIGLSPIGIESMQIAKQGNRLPKSVAPFIMMNFDENMTFFERVMNVVSDIILQAYHNYGTVPQIQTLLENFFPGLPPLVEHYNNYSLLLINGHFAMDGNFPLLPNQVEIGTLTAKFPKPLPEDLQNYMDGAENGVIYFSLGEMAKSTDIPNMQMAMLIKALGQLPQRVIWKFETDHLENLPSNIILGKWLPQQDILGHPACVLFISHCGNFGTQEAKYHGVPVLGVPISFDQHRNAAQLARKGYGRVLNWKDMTPESINDNINLLINDTQYRERMAVVSAALKDQKESPQERAVWWIEYAIRHNGAPHLQYAGKNLNAIQYYLIDVWAFLIAILMLWTTISYCCIRRCFRKYVGSKLKNE